MDGLAAYRWSGRRSSPAFWGLIRTAPDKRDMAAIKASQEKTTEAMKILDAQLGKTQFVAGDSFSYGDIPVGVMCYRYRQLVPERPRRRISIAGTTRSPSARRSRITSAAIKLT